MTRVALFILGPQEKIGKNIEILEKKKRKKKKKKKKCEFFWRGGVGGLYFVDLFCFVEREKRKGEILQLLGHKLISY